MDELDKNVVNPFTLSALKKISGHGNNNNNGILQALLICFYEQ